MNNARVILFDIDYTLFNARMYRDLFLEKIYEALGQTDWDSFLQQEEEVYKKNKREFGYFKPEPFLGALEVKFNKKFVNDEIKNIFYNEAILEKSIYEETLEVLQELTEKRGLVLGIFSAGIERMQLSKISPVVKFLHKEHIHIFEFNKKQALQSVLEKYKGSQIFLIDDILEILYNAKQLKEDIVTVWIKRGPYENSPKMQETIDAGRFFPDYTIENLRQLISIIN